MPRVMAARPNVLFSGRLDAESRPVSLVTRYRGMAVHGSVATRSARHERRMTTSSDPLGCRTKFTADPARYVDMQTRAWCAGAVVDPLSTPARCTRRFARSVPAPARSAAWRSSRNCPRRPKTIRELNAVKRKFWIATALSVPVVALAMLPHLLDLHFSAGTARIAAVPRVAADAAGGALGGIRLLPPRLARRAEPLAEHVHAHRARVCWSHTSYSLFATFAPQPFPPEMRDSHGMVGVYFEVAAVIIALVLLGEWLELAARGRTSRAIRQLLGLAPKTARRIRADGIEEDVAPRSARDWRSRARASG